MNNKKMNCQVVCAGKSARRSEGAMQMAHTHKSGAGARMNASRSFGTIGTPARIENSLRTFAQTGRSMIEMLGVLAIIGVLTIGGLMGYRYAMNKHKANTILNDVSLAMADLTVLDPDGDAITRRAVAFRPDSGLAMESERTADGNNIVYVSGVAKAVCQILIQIQPTDAYEHIYDGDLNALTTCADTQAMAFGSKETAEGPDTPECQNDSDCGANQVCQGGRCVDKPAPSDPCKNVECFNGGTCNEGSCDCVNGYTGTSCEIAPQCNDSKPCTLPKQCENYICVCPMIGSLNECQEVQKINGCDQLVNKTNATCGTNGFCSNGACSECTSPKVVNTAKNGCVCPKIEHCGMYDDACKCASCDEGYVVDETGSCIPEQTCPEIPFCTAYNEDCSCANCDDDHMLQANTCVEVECKVDDDCGTNMTCNNGKCECKDSSYAAVVNYNSDGSKNKFACCEVKADPPYVSEITERNYIVAGAINGSCCGGWGTQELRSRDIDGNLGKPDSSTSYTYFVRENGGVAYCAEENVSKAYDPSGNVSSTSEKRYLSDGKVCSYRNGSVFLCWCSASGNPSGAEDCS